MCSNEVKPSNLFFWVVFALMTTLLAACGGDSDSDGGSSTDADAEAKGSMAMLMTDAATSEFDAVLVTVTEATLIGDAESETQAGGTSHVEVFSGEKTFDLLTLTNVSEVFSLKSDIPVGSYSKIRLMASHVQLIKKDEAGNVTETIEPNLVANGKIDLVAQSTIDIMENQTTFVSIDFDAEKSIHTSAAGNSGNVNFRPVVFVDVAMVAGAASGKPIRLRGQVSTAVDANGQTELCNTNVSTETTSNACVNVMLSEDDPVFDESANAVVQSDIEVGDELIVYGSLSVVTHNETEASSGTFLAIESDVVQIDNDESYTLVSGTSQTNVDLGALTEIMLTVDVEHDADVASELTLLTQDQTVVYDSNGALTTTAAIDSGTAIQVEGVVNAAGDLNATVVFVEDGSIVSFEGTINTVDPENNSLDVAAQTGDVCVITDSATTIKQESSVGGAATLNDAAFVRFESGQALEIESVSQVDGCYRATSIIILE